MDVKVTLLLLLCISHDSDATDSHKPCTRLEADVAFLVEPSDGDLMKFVVDVVTHIEMIPGKTRVAGIAMAKDPVVCCTWSSLQTVDGTPGPTYSSGPCLQSCAAANQSLVTTDTSIDVARAVHVARTELLSTARVWVSWLPVLITRTHPLHLPTLLTETHLLRQQGAQLIVVAVGPLAGDVTRRLMDAGCNVITVNHSSLLSDMTAALLNLLCTDRFAAHSPDYKHDPLLLSEKSMRESCLLERKSEVVGMTCHKTWETADGVMGSRVGEGSTCWRKVNGVIIRIKCTNGIWRSAGAGRRRKRAVVDHYTDCPTDQHLTAPSKKICAVATWRPPSGDTTRHNGGNSGDCFPEGSSEVKYEYDGWLGWGWTSGDSCTFKIYVTVNRCPAAASLVNGNRSCDGQEDNVDGSVCTYTCVIGYELQGSGTVTCNRNSWSSPFPTCAIRHCNSPATFSNGDRLCTRSTEYLSRCRHTCDTGFELHGSEYVSCDASSNSAFWTTTFPTCAAICSWPKDHCWPGDCRPSNLASSCVCRPGFKLVNINNGVRCQLDTSPDLTTCRVAVTDSQGTSVNSTYISSSTSCQNQRDEGVRTQPEELYFVIKASLDINMGSRPQHVSDSKVGVVGAQVTMVKVALSGTETIVLQQTLSSTHCQNVFSSTRPLTGGQLLDCEATMKIPDLNLADGESFCADMAASSGGYYDVVDTLDRKQSQVVYDPVSSKKRVCFVYDMEHPVHCSDKQGECNTKPLELSTRLTRVPDIRVFVNGWFDPIPKGGTNKSASQIDKFILEVHRVDLNPTSIKVQDNAVANFTKQWKANLTSLGGPYEVQVPLPSDEPQLYAIILEVLDRTGNVAYARRLVMFDNSSSVELNPSASLQVVTADGRSGYRWQTDVSRNVCVEWTGRFFNSEIRHNNWLLPVLADTGRDIRGEYDQRSGLLPVTGTDSVTGVITFQVTWSLNGGARSAPRNVTSVKSEGTCLYEPLLDGQTYDIWIRATDIMGNNREDQVRVSIDHTAPVLDVFGLVGRQGRRELFVHNSTDLSKMVLQVHAGDIHSGLRTLQWTLGTTDQTADVGEDAVGIQRLGNITTCTSDNCHCPSVGECEVDMYYIPFTRLTNNNAHQGLHHRQYYITVIATNNAGLHTIKMIDILVDTSPPTVGVVWEGRGESEEGEEDFTSSDVLHVRWRGFTDHESGILLYRVALASTCLTVQDIEALENATETQAVDMTTLRIPQQGHYYVSVVAYNGAMSPSLVGCSDGITYDTTPPHLLNVMVAHARVGRTISCTQHGQLWLINSNLTRVQLESRPECLHVCQNISSLVSVEHLSVTSALAVEGDLSSELCRQLPMTTKDAAIMLPSDSLTVQWQGEDKESDIEDFWVGLGLDRSTASAPDVQPLTPTDGRQFFHLTHTGLGHGDIFYLFLRVLSKAGLESQLTIGPLIIDVTPPDVTQPLTVVVEGDLLVTAWTHGMFTDSEQPRGVEFVYTFRVGHEGGFVTPFLTLPDPLATRCKKPNITGCISYPVTALYPYDTQSGRRFFFQLHVTNAAGHVVTVNTSSERLPNYLPPEHAVVFDIVKIQVSPTVQTTLPSTGSSPRHSVEAQPHFTSQTADTSRATDKTESPAYKSDDVDVILQTDEVCIAWEGFSGDDAISVEVGIGALPNSDDFIPFTTVLTGSPTCVDASSLPLYKKLYSVVRATNTGGQTVFSSDGFTMIPKYDQKNNQLMVFAGRGCRANDIIGTSVLSPSKSSRETQLMTRTQLHAGDVIFVQLRPFVGSLVFSGAVVVQTTLTGYQLVMQADVLRVAVPQNASSDITVDVMTCQKEAVIHPKSDNSASVSWEISGPWSDFVRYFQVRVVDETCRVEAKSKDQYTGLMCLKGVRDVSPIERRFTFSRIDLFPGHQYYFTVAVCLDNTCLPEVTSDLFVVAGNPVTLCDEAMVRAQADHTLTIGVTAHVQLLDDPLTSVAQSSACVFRWAVSGDRSGQVPLSEWQVSSSSSCSSIQMEGEVRVNSTGKGQLHACIQVMFPWRPANVTCWRLSRPASLRQVDPFHVIELPHALLRQTFIDNLLYSQQLGSKLHELFELDIDFAASDVMMSAFVTDGYNRNVTWFLMTSDRVPRDGSCAGDPSCLTWRKTENGKVVFPRDLSRFAHGTVYYVCALISPREWSGQGQRSTTEEATEGQSRTTAVCGDGFVIDDVPPTRGSVAIGNSEEGFVADEGHLFITWTGFSDVEKDVTKLPDYVTMNFSVALGSYPGGEDIARYVQVGQRTTWMFLDLKIAPGTQCIATVRAEDRAGHVTESWSESCIVDNTPPTQGHVTVGGLYQKPYVASSELLVYWEGVEDKESGIKQLEVAVSTTSGSDDVIPFQVCRGGSTVLTQTSALVDGHSYVLLLRSTNKAGLTTLTSSQPFTVDSSPPEPGIVWNSASNSTEHRCYSQDVGEYPVYWSGFRDLQSGLAYFRVGLGSQPNETDIQPFVYVGLQTSYSWKREFEQGKPYYVTVEACNQAGLCTVTSSTSMTFDSSPPTVGHVVVGPEGQNSKYLGHNSSIQAMWTGFSDPQTGIQEFLWCIGTQPHGCDVLPVKSNLLSLVAFMSGLALPATTPLYVTVRARNPAGLQSVAVSESFTVDVSPPTVVVAPYFTSPRDGKRTDSQWDRSVLQLIWQFADPDSPVVSHTVNVRSQLTGRLLTEPIVVGADDKMTLTLDPDHLLDNGGKYWASVAACNAAGLCTAATSTRLLVDATPPILGTFRSPITWYKDDDPDVAAAVNVTWQAFSDPESGVVSYQIVAGRSYGGEDLSEGRVTAAHDDSSAVQHTLLFLSEALRADDVIFLGIWARNKVGMQSEMVRTAYQVIVDTTNTTGGLLIALRHSCPVSYCTLECSCAPSGQVCPGSPGQCHQLEVTDSRLGNVHVIPYISHDTRPQTYTTSVKCLEGHWTVSPSDQLNISRFEWSLGLTNRSASAGVFNPLTEAVWYDVGLTMEMTYCLPGTRLLASGQSYVLHVRAWLSRDSHVTFLSAPVTIDSSPPSVSRGKTVVESNGVCGRDVDYVTSEPSVTACWDGVFQDVQSYIVGFELWAGTSQLADDLVKKTSVGLNTSHAVSTASMEKGRRYYVTVRAVNGAGLTTSAVSDGVVVDVSPPIAGVVFPASRYVTRLAQTATNWLAASWHGFQDQQSAVRSYQVAIVLDSHPTSPVMPFVNVGFLTEYHFTDLPLRHNHRYSVVVMATDAAGLTSQAAKSAAILVDSTPPEGVTCSHFDLISEKAMTYISTSSLLYVTYRADVTLPPTTQSRMVRVTLTALNIQPDARGYVGYEELKIPVFFKYSHSGNASAEHLLLYSANSNSTQLVTVHVEARPGANMVARLSSCSQELVSSPEAISVTQISQTSVSVCARVYDKESGIKTMIVGLGTTPGGLQVQPFTPVGHSGHFLFDVHVQHGAPLYASVMAENGAGHRVHFISSAIYMDKTAPLVSEVKVKLIYEGEGQPDGPQVRGVAEWTAHDNESGIVACTCRLVSPSHGQSVAPEVESVTSTDCVLVIAQPRHRESVIVSVRCINGVQMDTTVTSQPVTILLQPPDLSMASLVFLDNNPVVSPFDERDVEVRSRNSSLELTWRGVDDTSVVAFYYRLHLNSLPLTEWSSLNTYTTSVVALQANRAPSGGVLTAQVRASNDRGMTSDIVSSSVLLDDSRPSTTGKTASATVVGDILLLDWSNVFSGHRDLTYLVFAGTAQGFGDVINHVTVKTPSYRQQLTKPLDELFVLIRAVYANGMSKDHVAKLSL